MDGGESMGHIALSRSHRMNVILEGKSFPFLRSVCCHRVRNHIHKKYYKKVYNVPFIYVIFNKQIDFTFNNS